MTSEKADRQATAAALAPTPRKRSAQARIAEPGRKCQPSAARERWKHVRAKTRAARLDAQHDSAIGHAPWPGTPPWFNMRQST
jgi:hypothetical protein